MAKPARNARPDKIASSARTFFATTKTSQGLSLLQSERNATLMIDVLRSYVAAGKFRLHDFVVMPDHLHLLITVGADMTIEKAMQLVKGRVLVSLEEGMRIPGRSLAARVLRTEGRESVELHTAPRVHRGEPGRSRTRRLAGEVSLLLCEPGKAKSAEAKAL
jgi:putative transposase